MRIPCPHCGPRDNSEFTYLGDATVTRPAVTEPLEKYVAYTYIRTNSAGPHSELWYHAFGCRSWLRVTRDVRTHAIEHVEAVADMASRGTE